MSHTGAPIPVDEAARLSALHAHAVLDTPPEEAFDAIARIAARLYDAQVALVTFVDRERQWFKARVGVSRRETPRDLAFCAHTILSDDVLAVGDAAADSRFSTNPLVAGPPHFRFYLGAPLIATCGARLGTVCVIDPAPRDVAAIDATPLQDLARLVIDQLALRQSGSSWRAQAAELSRDAVRLGAEHRELDAFVRAAAHDLRAPLRHIAGFGQLLAQTLGDTASESARSHLGRILSAAERMDQLVCALYAYARSEEPAAIESVDAGAAARDAVEQLAHAASEASAKIEIGELPVLHANAAMLTRVMRAAIENALAFRSDRPCEIEVAAVRDAAAWRLEVRDNGTGIAPDLLQAAFEPFRRVGTSASAAGAGLGLTVCRRIIERMGGRIWLDSSPGAGTTLCFTIPDRSASELGAGAPIDGPAELPRHV